jgi:mRNA-degrading endonuclease RelE of RelBE toxin-antitoxin system
MIYEVKFTRDADKAIAKFKKSNPNTYKKLTQLLN